MCVQRLRFRPVPGRAATEASAGRVSGRGGIGRETTEAQPGCQQVGGALAHSGPVVSCHVLEALYTLMYYYYYYYDYHQWAVFGLDSGLHGRSVLDAVSCVLCAVQFEEQASAAVGAAAVVHWRLQERLRPVPAAVPAAAGLLRLLLAVGLRRKHARRLRLQLPELRLLAVRRPAGRQLRQRQSSLESVPSGRD